eukprot:5712574-Amphidinium_carterae.1
MSESRVVYKQDSCDGNDYNCNSIHFCLNCNSAIPAHQTHGVNQTGIISIAQECMLAKALNPTFKNRAALLSQAPRIESFIEQATTNMRTGSASNDVSRQFIALAWISFIS